MQKNAALEAAVKKLKEQLRAGAVKPVVEPVNTTVGVEEIAAKLKVAQSNIADLRSKNQKLQGEKKDLEEQLQKSQARVSTRTAPMSAAGVTKEPNVAVQQWEKEKRLTKQVDTLKQRLVEQQKETEKAKKAVSVLQEKLQRLQEGSAALESRLAGRKEAKGGGGGAKPSMNDLGDVVHLKKEVYRLDTEAIQLQCALDDKDARIRQKEDELRRMGERLEMVEACGGLMGDDAPAAMENQLRIEVAAMEKQLQKNEDELMRVTLQKEESRLTSERQKRRIDELEDVILVLREQDKSRSTAQQHLSQGSKASGKESVAQKDLEKVIEGLNEVVKTLQVENETNKKKASVSARELKALKEKATEMVQELEAAREKAKQVDDMALRITKLNDIGVRTARQLKKQTENTEKLRALVSELNDSKARLEQELKHAEEQLSATARESSVAASGQADADRERRVLEDSLITLQEKNRRIESQLERWRKELTEARAELDEAHHTIETLRARDSQSERELSALRAGHQSMEQLESEVRNLKHLAKQLQDENARLLRSQGGQTQGNAVSEERLAKLEAENRDLRAELSSFDPAFWEEIEDLKYREHESKQLCRKYEKMLTELSQQYGFPFSSIKRRG